MRNVAVFKAPTLKPLPGELTPASIREAVLPVKIAAMSRAIAQCQQLPELLNYKKTVDGLAAAARTIKYEIPTQVAMLNRTAKEAIFRLGELLLQYDGTTSYKNSREAGNITRNSSARGRAAMSLGISPGTVSKAMRLASAPKATIAKILEDESIVNILDNYKLKKLVPRRTNLGAVARSENVACIMGGTNGANGLVHAVITLRGIPLNTFAQLTPEECKRVKAKIVEAQELLDAMDQRLKL